MSVGFWQSTVMDRLLHPPSRLRRGETFAEAAQADERALLVAREAAAGERQLELLIDDGVRVAERFEQGVDRFHNPALTLRHSIGH